jgi:hypothetical protein
MLSIAVRVSEVLALLVAVALLMLAIAAAFAWWLRRRLRRLVHEHTRALLLRVGLPASVEVLAGRTLKRAWWRRMLARSAWRAMTGHASHSSPVARDTRQNVRLRAAR